MIRKAVINDSVRIAEIHVFSWRCTANDFVSLDYLFNKMTVKNYEENIRKYLDKDSKPFEIYVFENDNIIKGFMTIGDCTDKDKDNNTFELENIYIEPLFQRQNIGTEMVNFFIKTATEKDKKEVIIWVFEKNIKAIKFYSKMGFVHDGEKRNCEVFNDNNEIIIRLWKKI
jgi:ribosomal protein S18 acetylase RimI-like enzyme